MLTETTASAALETGSPAARGHMEALLHPVQEQVFFEQYLEPESSLHIGTAGQIRRTF